jgi:hypothetical protein
MKRECKGSFQRLEDSDFILDKNKEYSDMYILQKGLWEQFGGVLDTNGTPVWDEEKNDYKRKDTV